MRKSNIEIGKNVESKRVGNKTAIVVTKKKLASREARIVRGDKA